MFTFRIKDFSNGLRFYDRPAMEALFAAGVRYGSPVYLSESLAILLARHATVAEFPATYVGRFEGLSKVRIVDLIKAGLAVFHIAARYHMIRLARLLGRGPAPVAHRHPAPVGAS